MSISVFLKSQKAFLLALDPLRQTSADLNKAKDNNNKSTTMITWPE